MKVVIGNCTLTFPDTISEQELKGIEEKLISINEGKDSFILLDSNKSDGVNYDSNLEIND